MPAMRRRSKAIGFRRPVRPASGSPSPVVGIVGPSRAAVVLESGTERSLFRSDPVDEHHRDRQERDLPIVSLKKEPVRPAVAATSRRVGRATIRRPETSASRRRSGARRPLSVARQARGEPRAAPVPRASGGHRRAPDEAVSAAGCPGRPRPRAGRELDCSRDERPTLERRRLFARFCVSLRLLDRPVAAAKRGS